MKKHSAIMLSILFLVLSFTAFASPAFAAGTDSVPTDAETANILQEMAKSLPVEGGGKLDIQKTLSALGDQKNIALLQKTVKALTDGDDLVIFAESPKRYSEYICELQTGFIDLARLYYRKTKKALKFYPVYLEKKNAVISIGKPITYDPEVPLDTQRDEIAAYLRDNIDRLGRSLPKHKPVPFLPERWYEGYAEYENDVYGYWHMIGSGER